LAKKGVASSLKGYIPYLSQRLGISPAALYERQRALVRAGLLDMSKGRGPGTGVVADARAIAILVTAVLATGSLTDTETRVRAIASARREPAEDNAVLDFIDSATLPTTFLQNIEYLMFHPIGRRVTEITVSRTAAVAQIVFRDNNDKLIVISFAGPGANEPGLRVAATLAAKPFREIASEAFEIQIDDYKQEKKREAERKRERTR
jgi:hypothetical protein